MWLHRYWFTLQDVTVFDKVQMIKCTFFYIGYFGQHWSFIKSRIKIYENLQSLAWAFWKYWQTCQTWVHAAIAAFQSDSSLRCLEVCVCASSNFLFQYADEHFSCHKDSLHSIHSLQLAVLKDNPFCILSVPSSSVTQRKRKLHLFF